MRKVLISYISNGPLIFGLYPAFGMRGASWFLGVAEWLFGTLLFLGLAWPCVARIFDGGLS